MYKYLEINGTHREIGRAIGEETRSEIAKALDLHFERNKKSVNKKNFGVFLKTAKKYFPDLVTELGGIAEGSDVSLEKLFAFSFEEELATGERCSTLAVRSQDSFIFAHNEDWDLDLPLYIVKAKPKGKPAFLAVSYAGHFAGSVAGLNEYGLVYAGNSLDTKVAPKGLPKTYCLRSVLDHKNINELVKFFSSSKMAIGNSSVVVSAREKRIVSLEWAPGAFSMAENDTGICHTNHFLDPKLKKFQTERTSTGSKARYEFLQKALENENSFDVKKVKNLMSEHFEKGRGVCQHWDWKTLASIIVDTSHKTLSVSSGNPCRSAYRTFHL